MALISKRQGELVSASITWHYVGPAIAKLRVKLFLVKKNADGSNNTAAGSSGDQTAQMAQAASTLTATTFGPVVITLPTLSLVAGNTYQADIVFVDETVTATPISSWFSVIDAVAVTSGGFSGPGLTPT